MAKKRTPGKYVCKCDEYSSDSYQAWYQHVRRKNETEPGRHGKVEMVVPATLAPHEPVPPGDFHEPTVPDNPCPDCEVAPEPDACPDCTVAPAAESCPDCVIAQRNLERRMEIETEEETYLNSCPGCGVVAALSEEEADVLDRVRVRFEQSPPSAEVAGDASVKAELPGPAVSVQEKKGLPPGMFLIIAFLAIVGAVVLVVKMM